MQIKHLWISKYKNIENVEFNFNSDLISLLVGQNGLGKSNLLEAIAIIFSSLDLAEKELEFTSEPHKDFFEFGVWYVCKGNDIRVTAAKGILDIELIDAALDEDEFKKIPFSEFRKERNRFIPDYIIGYYSGENGRIKDFFSRHSIRRINNLKKKNSDPKFPALGKMFFTEENAGELLFFTLWVYKDSDLFGETIRDLLSKLIKIENESIVQISFNNPEFASTYPEQNADDLASNIQNKVTNPFWGLTGKIDKLLHILYNNHSAHSIPISFEDETFDETKGKDGFVFFDKLDYTSLPNELSEEFKDPIYLFDALHAAHQMGIVYKIDGVLSKNGVTETHNFRELSEGERQLLTVLGLILITGRDDCLFLLDEPDTHLNPKWQREYVRFLHDFNINSDKSHILVCTHSPLIVQASEEADIFLFRKNANGKILIDPNDFKIQNWRIDQVLASDYFEFENTRAPILDEFMRLREELLSKPELAAADLIKLSELESATGVLPTGETLNDFKAMHLIRTIANETKENDQN